MCVSLCPERYAFEKDKREAAAPRRPARCAQKNRTFSAKRQALWFETHSVQTEKALTDRTARNHSGAGTTNSRRLPSFSCKRGAEPAVKKTAKKLRGENVSSGHSPPSIGKES